MSGALACLSLLVAGRVLAQTVAQLQASGAAVQGSGPAGLCLSQQQGDCPSGCVSCEQERCTSCIPGYYLEKKSSQCRACFKLCQTCSSYRHCTSCPPKYELDAGNCIFNESRISPVLVSVIALAAVCLILLGMLLSRCLGWLRRDKHPPLLHEELPVTGALRSISVRGETVNIIALHQPLLLEPGPEPCGAVQPVQQRK